MSINSDQEGAIHETVSQWKRRTGNQETSDSEHGDGCLCCAPKAKGRYLDDSLIHSYSLHTPLGRLPPAPIVILAGPTIVLILLIPVEVHPCHRAHYSLLGTRATIGV